MASDDNVTPLNRGKKRRKPSPPQRAPMSSSLFPQITRNPIDLVTRGNKLNPATHDAIVEGILFGHSLERIAGAVGIGTVTIYKWKNRGEKAVETHMATGQPIPKEEKPYANLALDIALAYQSLEHWALSNWMTSLLEDGQPRDWAEYLARRFPDKWAPTSKLTGKDGDPLQITLSTLVREAAELEAGEVVDAEVVE